MTTRRARRRLRRLDRARMTFDRSDPRHGKENGYVNLHCRCRRCTAAHSRYHLQYTSRPDRRRWITSQQRARARGAQNPRSSREWREAVDGAAMMLLIHSAILYGLIETDMVIDVRRCEEILAEGHRRGYEPRPTDELIHEWFAA